MVTVWNKFNSLQVISEKHTPNDKYKKYVTAHIEAAACYIQAYGCKKNKTDKKVSLFCLLNK